MKLLLVLVATGCIAWLLKTLVATDAPLSLEIYVGLLGVFYLLAMVQRLAQTSHAYAVYYLVIGSALCLSAVWTAVLWLSGLQERGLLPLIAAAVTACAFAWLIDSEIPRPKYLATDVLIAFGWCFSVAGLLSLASAIPPCGALQFRLRLGFGIFWLLTGANAFCDALGTFRARALWDSISGYASQVLCIVCLGGLAWLLSRGQWELSREPLAELVTQGVGQ